MISPENAVEHQTFLPEKLCGISPLLELRAGSIVFDDPFARKRNYVSQIAVYNRPLPPLPLLSNKSKSLSN